MGNPINGLRVVHVGMEFRGISPLKYALGGKLTDLYRRQADHGADVRVYIPRTKDTIINNIRVLKQAKFSMEGLASPVIVSQIEVKDDVHISPNLAIYLIENSELFGHDLYENLFAQILPWMVFPKVVIEHLKLTGHSPDILHAHEWQAGLTPLFIKKFSPFKESTHVVFTPHDPSKLGLFSADQFPLTGLDPELLTKDSLEYYGQVCLLKAGMQADLTLFDSDANLDSTIKMVEPNGIGAFVAAQRANGSVYALVPSEIEGQCGILPFPMFYAQSMMDAYKLLQLKDKGALRILDVMKSLCGRHYKLIMQSVNNGSLNSISVNLSLNMNVIPAAILGDPSLARIIQFAKLGEIQRDAGSGKYKKLTFESIIRYLPKESEQVFEVIRDEERVELFDPTTRQSKRESILTYASREILALQALESKIAEIDPYINEHHIPKAINRELGIIRLKDKEVFDLINRAVRKTGNLTLKEGAQLRVLLFLIRMGHKKKIWQANTLLKKIDKRIILSKGEVSIIDVRSEAEMNKGRLVLLSGPSGTGKGRIMEIADSELGVKYKKIVLHNTRDPRAGEKDGEAYHFIKSDPQLIDRIAGLKEEEKLEILDHAISRLKNPISDEERQDLIRTYLPSQSDDAETAKKKIDLLARVQSFIALVDKGNFCAVTLVRQDFQAISREMFKQVNSSPDVFFLECDTTLASQVVSDSLYSEIDSVAVMLLPPTAEELKSRLLGRNTEGGPDLLKRYKSSSGDISQSKNKKIHDFYVTNDDPYRSAMEFATITGLYNTAPRLWQDYSGEEMAVAYYDILQQLKDSNVMFNLEPLAMNAISAIPSTTDAIELKEQILQTMERIGEHKLSSFAIIDSIRKFAEFHHEMVSRTTAHMGIKFNLNANLELEDTTGALAVALSSRMNGILMATEPIGKEQGDRNAFGGFYGKEKSMISKFKNWIGISRIRDVAYSVISDINDETGSLAGKLSPEQLRMFADIFSISWIAALNPNVKWEFVVDSERLNQMAVQGERELVEGTLKRLNIPITYVESDNIPVDQEVVTANEWFHELWTEGFINKCNLPAYIHTSEDPQNRRHE